MATPIQKAAGPSGRLSSGLAQRPVITRQDYRKIKALVHAAVWTAWAHNLQPGWVERNTNRDIGRILGRVPPERPPNVTHAVPKNKFGIVCCHR